MYVGCDGEDIGAAVLIGFTLPTNRQAQIKFDDNNR